MMENTVNIKATTNTEVKTENFFTNERIEEIYNFLVSNHFYFPTYIVYDNESNKKYKFSYRSLKFAFHKLNCIKDGKIDQRAMKSVRLVARI